jgi:hypothetical protein
VKEIRAQARRMAMTAAKEKAQNYCAAGGVELGRILHIEDANPLAFEGGIHFAVVPSSLRQPVGREARFDPCNELMVATLTFTPVNRRACGKALRGAPFQHGVILV